MASFVLPSASLTKPNNLLHQQPHCYSQSSKSTFFRFPSRSQSILRSLTKGVQSNGNSSTSVKAQLNEVTGNGSSHASATPAPKSDGPKEAKKGVQHADERPQSTMDSEASVSEFMAQVSSLVKLVNSRDVVELQLKQSDCELVIRKKEALSQPTPLHNMVAMQSLPPPAHAPSAFPPVPPTSAPALPPASSSTKSSAPSPPAGKPKSSQPPLKSPMAGTYYRCPAPGEPPFVKVGDKVQKGQVVCIIEAMKLMNEIEADRTGTVVEILVEDGKPVSVDTPLFIIEP